MLCIQATPMVFRMFRKIPLLLVLLLPLASMAATPAPAVVRQAMSKIAAGLPVTNIGPAPIPGFYQALVQGRMVYVSHDGKYVMAGVLFDAEAPRNLTEARMRSIRREALATIPLSDKLVYAPPHPKYTITVFTDLDCPYCRVFHQHMAQYNAEGIAVQYLFWPRTGLKSVPSGRDTPSYRKAISVWCAKDRKKAFTDAKLGQPVPEATCPNPVAREYRLGESIGVDATPTIIAEDGSMISGYLPPAELLHVLRENRARGQSAGPGGVDPDAASRH